MQQATKRRLYERIARVRKSTQVFHEIINQSVGVFDAFLQPIEEEFLFFFIGELPFYGGMAHFFGEMREDDGGGVGNVETFGEAVHRDKYVAVSVFDSLLGKTGQLGAE